MINKDKKKYYAIKASMIFEKTVLVPVDDVKDIHEAIELVDNCIEDCSVLLLTEEAEIDICPSPYADEGYTYELTNNEAALYQIINVEE